MRKYIYLALISAAVILTGCRKKDASRAEAIPEIDVAEVMTDSIVLHNDYPGYLQAHTKAEVVGEVSGKLLTQNFTSGSYVSKGQVLFTIATDRYRDAVKEAEGSLASAISQRDFYTNQTQALQKAYEREAVSKMELLQAQASLRQAEASIATARAQLDDARTTLSKCTVRAPISGYITLNEVCVGNYINGEAAPQTLATIYDNSLFDAIFSIEDDKYPTLLGSQGEQGKAIYRNMPLQFQTPLPHSYSADLYYVAPSVDSSTGSLQLVGKVSNRDNELKDGMFVTVSLPYGNEPHAVIVKDASLSTDQLGKYLYVVNDSNKVVYTPVTVGPLYKDSLRVIEKGVRPGQKYVTEALLTVRNGMTVKPVLKKE